MPRAATIRLSLCFFLIVLFLLFFSGCHSQTPEIGEYPVIVNGKAVAVHPEKVVSLSPACTAYALLKGYPLYGVSALNGFPRQKDIPSLAASLLRMLNK